MTEEKKPGRATTVFGYGRVLIGKKSYAYHVETRGGDIRYWLAKASKEKVQANIDARFVEALQDKDAREAFLAGSTVVLKKE